MKTRRGLIIVTSNTFLENSRTKVEPSSQTDELFDYELARADCVCETGTSALKRTDFGRKGLRMANRGIPRNADKLS